MLKNKIPDIKGYTKDELLWCCENAYGSSVFKEYEDIEDWDVLVGVVAKKDKAKWDKWNKSPEPRHFSEGELIIEVIEHMLILMKQQDEAMVASVELMQKKSEELSQKITVYSEKQRCLQELSNHGDNIKDVIDLSAATRKARLELDAIYDERIKTLTELLALRNKRIERNQLLIDIQVGSIKPATTTTQ